MSQNNQSDVGRSRAKGSRYASESSYSKGGRSSHNRSSTARNSSATHRSTRTSNRRRTSGNRRKKKQDNSFARIAVGGVILLAAITAIVGIMKHMGGDGEDKTAASAIVQTETQEESIILETELKRTVSVNGVDITGLSKEEAKAAIEAKFPWSMTVAYGDEAYEVGNLISEKIDAVLNEIYSVEEDPNETYEIETKNFEEAAKREAAAAAGQWNKPAKNGSISKYDSSSDKFVFTEGEAGLAIDQDKLAADIADAASRGDYDAVIAADVGTVEPEITEAAAREKYKTIGSFTTKTTANSKRNTNIKLACRAINGSIIQPGDEFSFNNAVGQRTEEKGYQGAAAYNNGEVVEEIGGGVCQVSSTIYNAAVKAGLKTTMRRSHTFEPSYVTPGTDATVSWGGPDYKFVNNTGSPVGIKASYYDQTVTVSFYGIPVLEEGVSRSLESTKTKDYTTGTEEERNSGLQSTWETRLIVKKDGEVVSRDVDHTTTYKSHTKENDAAEAAAIAAAESLAAAEASSIAASESESASLAALLESSDASIESGAESSPDDESEGTKSKKENEDETQERTAQTGINGGPGALQSSRPSSSQTQQPQTSGKSSSLGAAPGEDTDAGTAAKSGPGVETTAAAKPTEAISSPGTEAADKPTTGANAPTAASQPPAQTQAGASSSAEEIQGAPGLDGGSQTEPALQTIAPMPGA